MQVTVSEAGLRPSLLTAARINAPQGARVIADMLHSDNACDYCSIVIDWDGDFMWDTEEKGPMPASLRKPTLVIYADKYYSSINRSAYIELVLDIEEVFNQDNFSNNVASELAQYIKEQFERKHVEAQSMKEYH